MGRLLPQKPPRRYPSGFCNLLDTDRDQEGFGPAPDLRAETLRWSSARGRFAIKDGFSPLLIKQNTACTRLLLRKAAANRHDCRIQSLSTFGCCFDAYQCNH